jgi:hypothetical protein
MSRQTVLLPFEGICVEGWRITDTESERGGALPVGCVTASGGRVGERRAMSCYLAFVLVLVAAVVDGGGASACAVSWSYSYSDRACRCSGRSHRRRIIRLVQLERRGPRLLRREFAGEAGRWESEIPGRG